MYRTIFSDINVIYIYSTFERTKYLSDKKDYRLGEKNGDDEWMSYMWKGNYTFLQSMRVSHV